MDNTTALGLMKQAVVDAAAAIRDLAAKSAAGQDISADLSSVAAGLEASVAAAGEPTGLPPAA